MTDMNLLRESEVLFDGVRVRQFASEFLGKVRRSERTLIGAELVQVRC